MSRIFFKDGFFTQAAQRSMQEKTKAYHGLYRRKLFNSISEKEMMINVDDADENHDCHTNDASRSATLNQVVVFQIAMLLSISFRRFSHIITTGTWTFLFDVQTKSTSIESHNKIPTSSVVTSFFSHRCLVSVSVLSSSI